MARKQKFPRNTLEAVTAVTVRVPTTNWARRHSAWHAQSHRHGRVQVSPDGGIAVRGEWAGEAVTTKMLCDACEWFMARRGGKRVWVPRLQYPLERYLLDVLRPTATRSDAPDAEGELVEWVPTGVEAAVKSEEDGLERLSFRTRWEGGDATDEFVHQLLVHRGGRVVAHPALHAFLASALPATEPAAEPAAKATAAVPEPAAEPVAKATEAGAKAPTEPAAEPAAEATMAAIKAVEAVTEVAKAAAEAVTKAETEAAEAATEAAGAGTPATDTAANTEAEASTEAGAEASTEAGAEAVTDAVTEASTAAVDVVTEVATGAATGAVTGAVTGAGAAAPAATLAGVKRTLADCRREAGFSDDEDSAPAPEAAAPPAQRMRPSTKDD